MFALSDSQLRTIWNAADGLPAEKRGIYLERIVAWLQFRNGRFISRDLDDARRIAGNAPSRRPWAVEELKACFIVKDSTGQKLAKAGNRRPSCSPRTRPGGSRSTYLIKFDDKRLA